MLMPRSIRYTPVFATTVMFALAAPARAQDAHYWTNQYGTRSELVGGLVVGSFLDLSATFYNPGAVAFVSEPRLVLATDAWEYQVFDFDYVAPEGLDLGTGRLRPAPSIFAVQIPTKAEKHRFAFSVITRHSFEADAQATRIPTVEQIADSGLGVASSIEAGLTSRLGEGWIGLSWAHLLGERVGIGATTYIAARGQFGRRQSFVQTVDSVGAGLSLRTNREFSYWNVRVLWKAGVALNLRPFSMGLTVTTPGISVLGNGRVLTNEGITGIDPNDGTTVNELVADFQDNIGSKYKSPPSVALGTAYRIGRTTLYASAEWFESVGEYTILDTDEFVGQTTGDTVSNDLIYELKDVLNFGVGAEHRINERFQLYGAFFSDHSALPEGKDDYIPVALADWDIWHLSAGGAFVIDNIDITLGASYGWGSDTILTPIVGEQEQVELNYHSFKIIFGFGVGL